jgi:hypothetical protein
VEAEAGTCINAKVSISVREWRKLVEAQKKIEEREEQLLTELLHLRERKRLLRERAGDFFAQDCEEIQEMEGHEKERKQREKEKDEERERQEILRRRPPISELLRDGGRIARLFCDVPLVGFDPSIFDSSDAGILESSTASAVSNRIL